MKLHKIIETIEAEVIVDADKMNAEIDGVCGSDLMSDVLYYCGNIKNILLITGLTNPQVVYTAEMVHIKAVLFIKK